MQLVATNGPLAGTAITVADGLTLGDAADAAAATCCRIYEARNGGFTLQSLDSDSPVFINGLPAGARLLEPYDEVRIGDTLFVVHADLPETSSQLLPCAVRLGSPAGVTPFIDFSFEDALLHEYPLHESPDRVDRTSPGRERRDLAALVRISGALSAIQGLAALDSALAALILDIVPGRFVAFGGAEEAPAVIQSGWTAARTSSDDAEVDPALLSRAVRERRALAAEIRGRHVIVVPMIAFGRASGSIWVETANTKVDDGQVRILLVVGALAAVARQQAHEAARLQEANELLRAQINLDHDMVGRSQSMGVLFERIMKVARTQTTLLINGESGTGKELVARAVHRNSPRAGRPFVAINCAAITETLLESELFGHEKGAFTGALGLKKGKLEIADGGTLFLDEIGELPLPLQAKLLRAIQEREFERVGGTRSVRVDFRLIAATNRDLGAASRSGTFRQDLFYRLNVVTLTLPPLRDRLEDLPLLTDHFVHKHAARCGRRVRGVAPDALARLTRHGWPGNVRELENVIEQALALGSSDHIVADDLPIGLGQSAQSAAESVAAGESSSFDYHATVEETKRQLILRALAQANRSPTGAARLLGVHPNYLHRLMRNLNLRSSEEPLRTNRP
jgi:Nif-specific regulatory protein